MKVTKSYIKQLIMEELNPNGREGGTMFEEEEEASFNPDSDPHMKAVRDRSEGELSAREVKAKLNFRLTEMVQSGEIEQEVAEELMQAVGSRFKPTYRR